MASERTFPCPDHPSKELIFLCAQCNQLICNRCKKADHEGHRTKDVAKVAAELREQWENDQQLKAVIVQDAKRALDMLETLLEDFETSVKNTQEEIRDRGEALKSWIDKHVQKKLALLQRLAERTERRQLSSNIQDVEAYLEQIQADETDLRRNASDYELVKQSLAHQLTARENGQGLANTRQAIAAMVPAHKSTLFLHDCGSIPWKAGLRDFIGRPGLAQTSKVSEKNGLALALKLKCSDFSEALVFGLCVVGAEGRVAAAVTTDDPVKGVLKLFDETARLVHEEPITVVPSCKLFVSSGRLLSACTLTGAVEGFDSAPVKRFLSQATEGDEKEPATSARPYTLKREPNSSHKNQKRKTKSEHYKIYEINEMTSKHVFNVSAQNAHAVITDSAQEFFAVIQSADVPSESMGASPISGNSTFYDTSDSFEMSVAVFRRPASTNALGSKTLEPVGRPFAPEVSTNGRENNFRPTDACFYSFDLKQEVLVVADAGSNSLLQVALKNENKDVEVKTIGPLTSDCPLLDAPTALTTDSQGRLWIGCRGGKILTLVPKEKVCEGDYIYPRTLNEGDSSCYDEDATDDVYQELRHRSAKKVAAFCNQPIATAGDVLSGITTASGAAGSASSSGTSLESLSSAASGQEPAASRTNGSKGDNPEKTKTSSPAIATKSGEEVATVTSRKAAPPTTDYMPSSPKPSEEPSAVSREVAPPPTRPPRKALRHPPLLHSRDDVSASGQAGSCSLEAADDTKTAQALSTEPQIEALSAVATKAKVPSPGNDTEGTETGKQEPEAPSLTQLAADEKTPSPKGRIGKSPVILDRMKMFDHK